MPALLVLLARERGIAPAAASSGETNLVAAASNVDRMVTSLYTGAAGRTKTLAEALATLRTLMRQELLRQEAAK